MPVSLGVDAGGDPGVHAHHPAVLANLDRQRISPPKVYGPASSGRSRNALTWAWRCAALSLTGQRDNDFTPSCSTNRSPRRVETPHR